jgi:hypothetical protein
MSDGEVGPPGAWTRIDFDDPEYLAFLERRYAAVVADVRRQVAATFAGQTPDFISGAQDMAERVTREQLMLEEQLLRHPGVH